MQIEEMNMKDIIINMQEIKAQEIIDNWDKYTHISDANYFESNKEYENLYIKDCYIKGIRNATFRNCLFENVMFVDFDIISTDIVSLLNIDAQTEGLCFDFRTGNSNLSNGSNNNIIDVWGFSISFKDTPPKYSKQPYILLMPTIKNWLHINDFLKSI
jgi:hypothetical protein